MGSHTHTHTRLEPEFWEFFGIGRHFNEGNKTEFKLSSATKNWWNIEVSLNKRQGGSLSHGQTTSRVKVLQESITLSSEHRSYRAFANTFTALISQCYNGVSGLSQTIRCSHVLFSNIIFADERCFYEFWNINATTRTKKTNVSL